MGLVDQRRIASMQLSLDGSDEGLRLLLTQLDQLGAARSRKGCVTIQRGPETALKADLLGGLLYNEAETWGELALRFLSNGMDVRLSEDSVAADMWVGKPADPLPSTPPRLWLMHGNGKALVGSGSMEGIGGSTIESTFIDAPTLVCGTSVLLHRLLRELGMFWVQPVTDRWLTLTARLDGVEPTDATRLITSAFGPGTATWTSDGLGSLVRFRLPLESTPEKLLTFLEQQCSTPAPPLEVPLDVGPFPALSQDGTISFDRQEIPESLKDVRAIILGVGGLGSWAAPLLLNGCDKGTTVLTLIDGDDEVEAHNLNRQVLYDSRSLGVPKAVAAKEILTRRFGLEDGAIVAVPVPMGAQHVCTETVVHDCEEISLTEIVGAADTQFDEAIVEGLDSMQLALSCLDNQLARTLLNKACHERGRVMVNGGGEGVVGIVETFGDDSCMVCRYGAQEARAVERVSCQEEGERPVTAIVTTTAYVGAMMAAVALCVLARQRGYEVRIPVARDWVDGLVSERAEGRLPWMEGGCGGHL